MAGVAQDELEEKGALKKAGVYKYWNLIYLHEQVDLDPSLKDPDWRFFTSRF